MLYSLPSNTERVFVNYLAAGFDACPIFKAFSTGEFSIPCVIIKAEDFRQIEPGTHVYEGRVIVSLLTQTDDLADPVATHDERIALLYDLIADKEGLAAAVNVAGNGFKLWNCDIVSFSQDRMETERALVGILELTITAQTLEVV